MADKPADIVGKVPWLDWIRFLAAAMVVGVHARAETWAPWGALSPTSHGPLSFAIFALTTFGHEAVVLFFVLSGFFVGGKIWDAIAGQSRFVGADYAIDRICRIYVPLLPALVLTWAAYMWGQGVDHAALLHGCVLGLQGVLTPVPSANVSLWSLSYEIWFYVGAGAVAGLVLARSVAGKVCAGLLIALTIAIFTVLKPTYILYWLVGAASWRLGFRCKQGVILLTGSAFFLAGLAGNLALETYQGDKENTPRLVALLVMSCGLCPLLGALRGTSVPAGLARFEQVGSSLAAFSYTLYLVHFPVFVLLRPNLQVHSSEFNAASLSHFSLRLVCAYVAAFVLYTIFERNTWRVRRAARVLLGKLA